MSSNFGNIALAAARIANRKKSHNEIVDNDGSVGGSSPHPQQDKQSVHNAKDVDGDDGDERSSLQPNSAMDLKEFASAVRTFPETILKSVLEIYHKQQERKSHRVLEDDHSVQDLLQDSKSQTQDEYHENEHFLIASDDITVHELSLPACLRPSHQYTIDPGHFDEQHRYVYRFLLDGQLKFFRKNYVPFEHAALDADTIYRAKLNLQGLKQTDTALPRGSGFNRGSSKGRIQWKRGNKASIIDPLQITGDRRRSADIVHHQSPYTPRQDHTSDDGITDSHEIGESVALIGDDEDPGDYFDHEVLGIDMLQSEGGIADDSLDSITSKRLLSMSEPDYIYTPTTMGTRLRLPPLPFTPNLKQLPLLFKFRSFSLEHLVLPIEPMFCSIALYDVQTRRKLSETFHFTIHNDVNTLRELDIHGVSLPQHWTDCNNELQEAILSVHSPNPNIYVVLWIDKILQHNSGVEPYAKPPKKSTLTVKRTGGDAMLNIQAMRGKIREAYEYLAPYRQPLFWSFEPLFDISNVDEQPQHLVDDQNQSTRTATDLTTDDDDEIDDDDDTLEGFDKVDEDDLDHMFHDNTASTASCRDSDSHPGSTPRISDLSPWSPTSARDSDHGAQSRMSSPSSHRSSISSIETGYPTLEDYPSVGFHTSRSSASSVSSLPSPPIPTAQLSLKSSASDAYRKVKLRQGIFTFSRFYSLAKTDGKRRESVYQMILEFTNRPVVAPDGTLFNPSNLAAVSSNSESMRTRTVNATSSNKSKKRHVPGAFCMEILDMSSEITMDRWLSSAQKEYEGRMPEFLRNEWDELDHLNHLRQQKFHHTQPLHNGVHYVSPLHLDYKHTLYFYPNNFNFTNLGIKDFNPRNIAIRILLRDNDNVDEHGMPVDSIQCIVANHSRNETSGDGLQYQDQAISVVNYKNRYPQFFEEIRIDLPIPLNKHHHLLFEFYHISTRKSIQSEKYSTERRRIGVSIVHLIECDQIKSGWHSQPVYKHLVNGYLEKHIGGKRDAENVHSSAAVDGEAASRPSLSPSHSSAVRTHVMEMFNNGKHIFRYNFQLRSSFYPQEGRAMSFVRTSSNLIEKETSGSSLSSFFGKMLLPRAISTMEQMKSITDWNIVVAYLPSILNTFLYVMANMKGTSKKSPTTVRDSQVSATTAQRRVTLEHNTIHALNMAFETMLTTVRGCVRLSNRINRIDSDDRDNFIMTPYVSYLFSNPERSCRPVYAVIAEQWNQFMTNCMKKDRSRRVIETREEESPSEVDLKLNTISSGTGTLKRGLQLRGFSFMKDRRVSIRKSISSRTFTKADLAGAITNNTLHTVENSGKNSGQIAKDEIAAKDSLRLSWFLFDLIIKSLVLYTAPKEKDIQELHPFEQRGDENSTITMWTPKHISTDKEFFENMRELQRKIVENMCDLLNGNDVDVKLARKTNSNIALFICDLLDVAFLPSMRQYAFFRQFIFNLMDDYILASEIKKSSTVMLLRLEFLEILVDHENFIEYCVCTNDHYLSSFAIDVLCQGLLDSSFENRTRSVDLMFERILLKSDYNIKYQSEGQRNEISKLFFPFVIRLIEDEDLMKHLTMPEQHKCMLIAVQILKNRRRTEWREWWWIFNRRQHTRKPRPVDYLCGFVNLLGQMLHSVSNNPVKIMRKTGKLTVLDIFDCLVHDMLQFLVLPKEWDRIESERQEKKQQKEPGTYIGIDGLDNFDDYSVVHDIKVNYYPLLEECCLFMVRHLDQNTKDAEYTERFFLPKFYQLLMNVASRLCVHNDDPTWKACVGVLLKFVEFPLDDPEQESPACDDTDTASDEVTSQPYGKKRGGPTLQLPYVIDALKVLMDPHMKELEEELDQKRDTLKLKIEEDSDENILIDGTHIKAATLDKLVERVTSDKEMDPKFREIFFITYRSFTNAFVLLDKLIQRFRISLEHDPDGGDKSTLRVINAIKLWIDKHFFDFNGILTTRLILFLDNEASKVPNVKAFCKNLRRSLSTKLINASEIGKGSSGKSGVMFSKKPPPAIIPKNFNRYVQFDLLDWSSLEFARQLTLIEYDYFRRIEPKECLSGAWAKKAKHILAPNIAALTDRWNNMTQWIATEILRHNDLKMRRAYVIKFIEIAEMLRSINNFNGVTEIMAGLSNVSVHRLKRTWESIPDSIMTTFKELQELVDQQQSNKKMREALLRAPPPCVPPLSLYLKDLTFIVDGNPDTVRNGLINVFKRRQISKVILEIRQYQQTPYHFERVSYLREVIMKKIFKNLMDDNTLWKKSNELEPRQR